LSARKSQNSFQKYLSLFSILLFVLLIVAPVSALALGKKLVKDTAPEKPFADGKRVIRIAPIENVRIELPDKTTADFGNNFKTILETRLTRSNRFIVVTDVATDVAEGGIRAFSRMLTQPKLDSCNGISWDDSSTTPVATLNFNVKALSFQTGYRGERMFYGFDERFRTLYNSGRIDQPANEFPLRDQSIEPNFFDRSFDDRGSAPLDSWSGLDLGDGIRIDALFAWLSVKYARYLSTVHLDMSTHNELTGENLDHLIQVHGKGFYYDLAGAYKNFSLGIQIARRDAMDLALTDALNGAYQSVESQISDLPLLARVDHVYPANFGGNTEATPVILLGTGLDAKVTPGTKYSLVGNPSVVLQIEASCTAGSTARVIHGDAMTVKRGAEFEELKNGVAPRVFAALAGQAPLAATTALVNLPDKNYPKAKGLNASNTPRITFLQAVAKSIVESAFLGYRIYRYLAHDQAYHVRANLNSSEALEESNEKISNADLEKSESQPELTSLTQWCTQTQHEEWARQISLDKVPPMVDSETTPVIAVIDTGIDYNHGALHDALWINPKPFKDPSGEQDLYGWDFISGDSRPYDDLYHGTEVASVALAVAPRARIMALKAFNPFGVTSSAALFASFQYAVDHGAHVILAAWAARPSGIPQSLRDGIQYARDHGVVVVAAAGDRGKDLEKDEAAYPAAYGKDLDNLLVVTSVDAHDQLIKSLGHQSNHGSSTVRLAAPGFQIQVAEPLGGHSRQTSSAYSAAMVAGALARTYASRDAEKLSLDAVSLIQDVMGQSDSIAELKDAVANGARLHLKK